MAGDAVIVVHGLWMNRPATWPLRRRLARCGHAPLAFGYPSLRPGLAENAERLAAFARAVPGPRVHFVGHSLGALLVLEMLERARWQRPGRAVLLAPPLQGSHVAAWLQRFPWGRALLGRSMADWLRRPGARNCGPVELGVLAGDLPFGAGRIVPGLPQPSDGTVALAETALPGARDAMVLHVTHTGMLFSAAVAAQCCAFLATGRFERGAS